MIFIQCAVCRDGHGPDFFGLGWAGLKSKKPSPAQPSPAQPVGRPIWVKPGPNRRIGKKPHILTNKKQSSNRAQTKVTKI